MKSLLGLKNTHWISLKLPTELYKKQEPKGNTRTYVYNVASSVEHQVSIVSVLYLQQEAHNGVRSHTFNKVCSSLKIHNQPSAISNKGLNGVKNVLSV